jgi:hypothetical protein
MDSFYGTEAAIRMVCVSYNLMSLFRQVTHQMKDVNGFKDYLIR